MFLTFKYRIKASFPDFEQFQFSLVEIKCF